MDFILSAKLIDFLVEKAALPAVAFGVGMAAKPLVRRIRAHWFRFTSSRYAKIFTDLEKETITIQAGEPYFRFEDIRIQKTPLSLRLCIPESLRNKFSGEELALLEKQGIRFNDEDGNYLHFSGYKSFVDFLSEQLGEVVGELLPLTLERVAKKFCISIERMFVQREQIRCAKLSCRKDKRREGIPHPKSVLL